MDKIIKFKNVSKSFEQLHVLNQITMDIERGSFVSIIGPSGCGKSTIFKLLTKLDDSFHGEIIIHGESITNLETNIGYMPQKDLLLPWKTVINNVLLPLTLKKQTIVNEELEELIELFGLKGFENVYPNQLSGGMRQRAGLLRSMLMGEELLLLDEPFAAIDSINRLKLQKWLLTVFEKTNKTILFITHDIDEAILLSNKIYVLSDRPATVLDVIDIHFNQKRDETLLTTKTFNDYKHEILSVLNKNNKVL